MNLKSKNYMKSSEFKGRQLWLNFVDAVGITLQILEEGKRKAWQWFKAWAKKLPRKQTKNLTLALPFDQQAERMKLRGGEAVPLERPVMPHFWR